MLRLSPTNVAPSVILEGEDYRLKVSINAQDHLGAREGIDEMSLVDAMVRMPMLCQ